MTRLCRGAWLMLCVCVCSGSLQAVEAADGGADRPSLAAPVSVPRSPPIELESLPVSAPVPEHVPSQRNGRQIYESFRAGLAEPECDAAATSVRWKKHFSHAPVRLAQANDDLLPLFGYVVDALREADLPTEFALIPFVESGYKPGARSASGPAGLWQFIAITARNHGVAMRDGYDGRLSPVESTQAAVRYLKTLNGMFGGDWRLAVMGYNAGEYRILQSMRRAGMNAQNAKPAQLPGLSGITYAYVEKLHALACIFQQADDREEWMRTLDRQVPRLAAQALPADVASLDAWARSQGHDSALLRRLNPALAASFSRGGKPMRVLAPASREAMPYLADVAGIQPAPSAGSASPTPVRAVATRKSGSAHSHTVRRGESAWTIARRYGMRPQQLLTRNGLASSAILQPGMILQLDGDGSGK
jgi:membrane-bound lytic murein transglycosylase D